METEKVLSTIKDRMQEALRGKKQEIVAQESGIPKGTLSKYLTGDLLPGPGNLIKFSRATGYSIHYLISGQEPRLVVDLEIAAGKSIESILREETEKAADKALKAYKTKLMDAIQIDKFVERDIIKSRKVS